MVKRLEFYVPQGTPIMTSNYTLRTITTPRGKRKQAVATHKGRKLYRFVPMNFKK
jgi:hypothetical protein